MDENKVTDPELELNDNEGTADAENQEEQITEQDTLEKLTQDLEMQKDKYIRLVAEFDNFKRRTARERIELEQTAGKNIIASLLEVLDDMDRAEKQMQKNDDVDQIKEGVALVFNKFRTILKGKGLKPMESIGKDFDVVQHEAITEVPASPDQKGKVIDEITKGYFLNDKLIRFAKVVVGK